MPSGTKFNGQEVRHEVLFPATRLFDGFLRRGLRTDDSDLLRSGRSSNGYAIR
jgi:hypothetical protein